MQSLSRVGCLLVLVVLNLVGSNPEVGAAVTAETHRCGHASLEAYPNAIISLKDSRTGITFYVESNGRRLVALNRHGGLDWCTDVLKQINPGLGKPVIRHLRLDGDRLLATCGKSDVATIDVKSGKVRATGRD